MEFASEKRHAAQLLAAVEEGGVSIDDITPLYEEADPALLYLLVTWLRRHYPASHPAAEGVLGRLVAVLGASAKIGRRLKVGEKDPIVDWFEETYDYREFPGPEFISLIVDKLEG